MLAQFVGGALGVLLVLALLGAAFADPPVSYVATVPGPAGALVALLAEAAISFGLMLMILFTTNTPGLMRLDRRLRGLPRRALHHARGAALGHEHEPGAHARLGAARQPLAGALALLRRPHRRHAARGRGLPAAARARPRCSAPSSTTTPSAAASSAAAMPRATDARPLTREPSDVERNATT